ncbi:MAG: hypothetical protein NVSMB19_14500 [Vulcanimicrobiaceae bacterium]
MTVEIVDLGAWGAASLVAEYDPCDDAIRINVRAVELVRAALGDAEAERFTAVAIAHERCHRERPEASEAEAHAYAHAHSGIDPAPYERVLRRARAGGRR